MSLCKCTYYSYTVSLILASSRWYDGCHQVHAYQQKIQEGDRYPCSFHQYLILKFSKHWLLNVSQTHRWCCILRPVSLALWWSPCQSTLMVSFSHTIAVCVNRTVVTILPCSVSVYATTAANPHESSYACYYDEARDTYLGDWYSVNWMEDSDVVRIHTHHTRLILDMLNNFFYDVVCDLIGGSEHRDLG